MASANGVRSAFKVRYLWYLWRFMPLIPTKKFRLCCTLTHTDIMMLEVYAMGELGGRSRRGIEEQGFERFNITLPPSIIARLEKFQKEEDRSNRSWCIQKALDEWLTKRGY